ncbi:MAG: response regulator [Aquabacterium sp.]|uniref:response regulator n=1 Tax=Aquabacterium sp. TaxID=1872578 RepID=UPI00271ECC02|nr:response regulator [Aquabacterium sp.]MDO9005602.1 response regulator [Aquabacterium sp.]
MPRILIIEDTPANLQLTMAILEGAGHVPLSAPNAEHGLRIASTEPVDLILMDIRLPGIDGLTATRLLKEDPRTARIPIIALTASAMKGDEQRMREGGCVGYVAKPIRYRELLDAVDEALVQGKTATRQN